MFMDLINVVESGGLSPSDPSTIELIWVNQDVKAVYPNMPSSNITCPELTLNESSIGWVGENFENYDAFIITSFRSYMTSGDIIYGITYIKREPYIDNPNFSYSSYMESDDGGGYGRKVIIDSNGITLKVAGSGTAYGIPWKIYGVKNDVIGVEDM